MGEEGKTVMSGRVDLINIHWDLHTEMVGSVWYLKVSSMPFPDSRGEGLSLDTFADAGTIESLTPVTQKGIT